MEEFAKAYKSLNDAQKKAVDTIDGPVLVIAGPGTGKTQLLSVRVANILSKAAVLPENILCLTFTESGQVAMRERLSRFLGANAYDVTISTYHAFGNELIRRYPEYTDESLGQRPIDELLSDEILRSLLKNLPYSNPLRNADVYLRDLISLVSDAKRALLTPADMRTIAEQNLRDVTKVNKNTPKILKGFTRISKAAAVQFHELLDELEPYPEHSIIARASEELRDALEHIETTSKTTELTAWKNAWLVKNSDNQFVLTGERTNRRLLAAADIYEAYEAELTKRAVFDYDDMIIRAVHALEQNDDFKFSLQERYQYILLDEFQDTNAAQFRLIELLTDNPVNEGRPNVLAVGDDDQAIYAFQGAHYSNMRKFVELFPSAITIPLSENYRSHADILHTAEHIALQIKDRLHVSLPNINKELVAAGKNLPKSSTIQYCELPSDVAELAWVAKNIQALIKDGMNPREIVVLAPKHRYLEALVPYLQSYDIAVQYERRDNVLEDRFVQEIITMSRLVMALSRDDEATADSLWPEILSYDCWQLDIAHIWQVSWEARAQQVPWRTIIMKDEALKTIGLFFTKLALQASSETLEHMLDYLVGRAIINLGGGTKGYTSPFYNCYFGTKVRQKRAGDFWQTLSHFTVLRQKLREYKADEDHGLTLADFITFVDSHSEAEIKIMNTVPHRQQASAVQLMTAYKSKGLEFDAVFVIGCQDEVWGSKARTNTSTISLPKNLEHIRYAGATDDERLRLFFVAVSRARHHLYLTSHLQTYGGKLMTRLRYLQTRDDENGALSEVLPAHKAHLIRETLTAADSIEALSHYWQTKHIDARTQPKLKELLRPRLEQFRLSISHINKFVDVIYGGPEAFFLDSILRFPQAPILDGEYGDAVHKTMEWIHAHLGSDNALPPIKSILHFYETVLRHKRLSDRDYKLLKDRGTDALKTFLSKRAHTFQTSDRHEYDFYTENVRLGEIPLSGKIDKLAIDSKAKTIIITDFKTGKSYATWSPGEAKLFLYRQQLYFYKYLVEHSRTFAGYKVIGGIIEFIEPDEEGKLHNLELYFDEAEAEQLQKLMRAVWRHILSLDLPNISAYPVSTAGIRTFVADLINEK
jgi:DNA helicase-2/ATP-dependent DNA helicase PcrA